MRRLGRSRCRGILMPARAPVVMHSVAAPCQKPHQLQVGVNVALESPGTMTGKRVRTDFHEKGGNVRVKQYSDVRASYVAHE